MKIDLSTREGYDIAAAIRGPDLADLNANLTNILKEVFTARIRALCKLAGYGVTRRRSLSRIGAADLRLLVEQAPTSSLGLGHYLRHIRDAATALKDEKLYMLATATYHRKLSGYSDEDIVELAGGQP